MSAVVADRGASADEMARLHADALVQMAQPLVEQQATCLAVQVPHMLAQNGPGYVEVRALIRLPGGVTLRFEGSLEIVE